MTAPANFASGRDNVAYLDTTDDFSAAVNDAGVKRLTWLQDIVFDIVPQLENVTNRGHGNWDREAAFAKAGLITSKHLAPDTAIITQDWYLKFRNALILNKPVHLFFAERHVLDGNDALITGIEVFHAWFTISKRTQNAPMTGHRNYDLEFRLAPSPDAELPEFFATA